MKKVPVKPHMRDETKEKNQLINELSELRKRIAVLETSETSCNLTELRYRTIIQASMDGFWLIDTQGRFLDVNDAYCRLTGYSCNELLAMKIQDVEAVETHEETVRHIREVIRAGHDRFETRHRCKNSEFVDVEVSTHYMDIGGGRFFAFLRDITERKKISEALRKANQELEDKVKERTTEWSEGNKALLAEIAERKNTEDKLRREEERYRLLFNNVSDAVFVHEVSPEAPGRIIEVNDTACKYLGYSREELLQMSVSQIDAPETLAIVPSILKKLFAEGRLTWEGTHLSKDGRRIPVEISNHLFELQGKPMILSTVRDITERKKADEALRVSEAELHDNYFTQSTINMILSESLGDITLEMFLQKALNMILAIPWLSFELIGSIYLVEDKPEVLVLKARYNLPEPLRESCKNIPFGKCLCGRAAQSQKIQFADHADEFHKNCCEDMAHHGHYCMPVLFGGRTLGLINIYLKEGHRRNQKEEEFLQAVADTLAGIIVRRQVEDEKEKLHAQLLQAQKMEAVGQLAGGVAHDFNNILTAMIGYGHMLKIKMKEDDPLRTYADHILSLSDRAANLTQSLLAFSRRQVMNPRPIDLHDTIRRVENLLARIIGEDIELNIRLSPEDLTIMADPVQIEQVFMNLATNARDAMPEGGKLEISTEVVEFDQLFIMTHGYGKQKKYAFISMSDTGVGIDEQTREKMFEPFFTTKEVGKGTGLGLSMVYGIVKQHDGYINVYSEQGKGTTFKIYFPLIQGKAEEAAHEVSPAIETGTETILIAEDEAEVRELTKKFLTNYGYKVIEAVDGPDAIDKFKRYRDQIQLLLLDVILPKKNAKEVYEQIKQTAPDIKVLFMSGYTVDIMHKQGIFKENLNFIMKPVSPSKLLRKVREVLDK